MVKIFDAPLSQLNAAVTAADRRSDAFSVNPERVAKAATALWLGATKRSQNNGCCSCFMRRAMKRPRRSAECSRTHTRHGAADRMNEWMNLSHGGPAAARHVPGHLRPISCRRLRSASSRYATHRPRSKSPSDDLLDDLHQPHLLRRKKTGDWRHNAVPGLVVSDHL